MAFPVNPSDRDIIIEEDDVLFSLSKHCGVVTLNRPSKLNSLNISMIDKLFHFYLTESKSHTNLFIQKSSIPKAFCAGGDVVALGRYSNAGCPETAIRLFENEYSLNYFFGRFKKPVVSLLNGITMGGGCGLSMHLPFRVVTETTRLTMPEMAIGFFPDVGATFFFSRLDRYLGWYVCLTGDILYGYNNLIAGTGTHYVPSARLPDLEKQLIVLSDSYDGFDPANVSGIDDEWYYLVNSTIEKFTETPKDDKFQYSSSDLNTIEEMFSSTDSIEEVFDYLETQKSKGNTFAEKTLEKFHERSLLSIKIGYRILKYSCKASNYDALNAELNLAKNMIINGFETDLVEGIYKKLVSKEKLFKWKFQDIHDVSDSFVNKVCFQEIKPFGQIFKFKNNHSLFPDSPSYVLDKFRFPSKEVVLKKLKGARNVKDVVERLQESYPQYSSKKGLEGYISHVITTNHVVLKGGEKL